MKGLDTDLKPLLAIYAIFIIVLIHVPLAVFYTVMNHMGLWTYLFLAANFAPYILYYVVVKRKEELAYLDSLLAEPREWNIDKTMEEYRKLINK